MHIGKVIRKYRKERHMTQEELAHRLGVTTPAVNKWENENSYPDIMLLAPIARLLDISLDTLLSFREDLTEEEIRELVKEADERLKKEPYEEVFCWMKKILETYPNCRQLIWQFAVILDAQRLLQGISNAEAYDREILDWYQCVLDSEDEALRTSAADSLFHYYLREEAYEEAETYLMYFSEQNPERKRKQALIYSKTGRLEEAYKAYEELLFSGYQMFSMIFQSIYVLAMQEGNTEKARVMGNKQRELARLFEMGKYYEVSWELDLATAEKDADTVISIMQAMLESVKDIASFKNAALYEHMTFRASEDSFGEELREKLLAVFRDEDVYDFLKEDERWKKLVGKNGNP